MNNIPQTQLKNIGIRSMTDSQGQNEFERQVLGDLLSLYNKANLIEIELDNVKEMMDIEDSYMKLSATKIQSMLTNVIENFINSGSTDKVRTTYPSTVTSSETYPVKVDLETFDITLIPAYTESKVNVYDELSEETFVPDSLKVELLMPDNPNVIEVIDSDVYRCFDKKSDTAWVRKITTDNTVSEVITVMNLYLPYDMVTTDLVNELVIKPFPVNSIDIKEIKYSSTYDVNYTTILDELGQYEKNIIKDYRSYIGEDYEESFNIRLNFPEKKIKVLTISFSQKSYIQNDGYRVFYIGAKEIQVNLNKYTQQYGEFEYLVDLGTEPTKQIDKIEVFYNNPNVADTSSLTSTLYEVDALGNETLINQSLPFTTTANTLKVKARLFPSVDRNTPSISKIKSFLKIL